MWRSMQVVMLVVSLACCNVAGQTGNLVAASQNASVSGVDLAALTALQNAISQTAGSQHVADLKVNGMASVQTAPDSVVQVTIEVKGIHESKVTYSDGQLRSEWRNDGPGAAGQRTDALGVTHTTPFHNLQAPAGVLSPISVLYAFLQDIAFVKYVSAETLDGNPVVHLRYSRTPTAASAHVITLIQRLSRIDLYLNANTGTVAVIAFTLHPDNNSKLDLPAEVRFSNYQPVSGVLVPFHIQRIIQGAVNMDFTATSVAINSGISDSEFALQ